MRPGRQVALRAGRVFSLRALLLMTDYPDGRQDKLLYYAQTHGLAEFLLKLRGRATLLAFLERIAPANYRRPSPDWPTIAAALKKHYALSLAELTRRFAAFVQARVEPAIDSKH